MVDGLPLCRRPLLRRRRGDLPAGAPVSAAAPVGTRSLAPLLLLCLLLRKRVNELALVLPDYCRGSPWCCKHRNGAAALI